MTRKLLVLAALQLVGFGLFAQQQTSTTRPAQLKPVKASAPEGTSNSPTTPKDSLEGRTVEYCDYMIAAIDSKVAYVKSDQTENEKALASGWFDRMAKARAAWLEDKEELIRRQTISK